MAFTEAVILGRRLLGQDAQRLGIVHKTCQGDKLLDTAVSMATDTVTQPYNRDFMTAHKKNMYSSILDAKLGYNIDFSSVKSRI